MINCRCGYADECDGEFATFYPLQDGGMCTVVPCKNPIIQEEYQCSDTINTPKKHEN